MIVKHILAVLFNLDMIEYDIGAYVFRHDGVMCYLHTSYIQEGMVTHDITRTKGEAQCPVNRLGM